MKAELDGGKYAISRVAFSPDGKLLGCANEDGTARVWDANTTALEYVLTISDYEATGLAFSEQSELLAIGSCDTDVRLFESATGELLATLAGHHSPVTRLQFWGSPPRLLVSYTGYLEDPRILVWDIEKALASPNAESEPRIIDDHSEEINDVLFADGGNQLVSGNCDGTARIWDVDTLDCLQTLVFSGPVSVALSSDETLLATSCRDNNVSLFRFRESEPSTVLQGHTAPVWSMAFSHDDQRLASWDTGGTIVLWNPHSGKKITTLRARTDGTPDVLFSPTSQLFVSSGGWQEDTVRIWGESERHIDVGFGVATMAFSSDGTTLATGSVSRGKVRLWDLESLG